MLCTFCNAARLANEAPCPRCGAPSPLLGGANGVYGAAMPPAGPGVWGGPTPAQTNTWGQQPWPGAAQTNNWGQQAWPEAGQTNTWGQQPWPGAAQVPPQMQQEETPTSR